MAYKVTANSQFSVNATTVVADWGADVVAMKDGGWITYSGYDSSYYHALFQRFTSDGTEKGDKTWVANQNASLYPESITALTDGGWVATYSAYGPGGPTWTPYRMEVYQLRFDAAGKAVGGVQQVNTFKNLEQWGSKSAGLSDGGWVVVWQSNDQDGDDAGIYQQRYSKTGTKVGGETRVNATTSESEFPNSVTGLSDGGWIVSWDVGTYTASLRGIFTQRYDKAGNKVGGTVRVTDAKMDKDSSVVTSLVKGGWVVTWSASDFKTDSFGNVLPGPHGLFQQQYDAHGKKIGGAVAINTPTKQNQYSYEPDTVALADGGWVTVWSVDTATGMDIYQQRFSATGAKIDGELRVNTHTTGEQHSAKVTAFANGSWLVSWSGEGPGDDAGIHQRYFAADISGNSSANILKGTRWAETLRGNAGNDTLTGGGGGDVLIGGTGADKLDGGTGTDTASYQGALKGVTANLAKSSLNTNDAEGDTYVSVERLIGTSYADVLTGNVSDNVLNGEGGTDRLYGGSGNDALYGGQGADRLYGGAGIDSFVFTSVKESNSTSGFDTIYDFSRSQKDKIDLKAIDASTRTGGGQAFSFIGTDEFQKKAGELRYELKSGDTYVYGDVDGNGTADFVVRIDASIVLKSTDFVL